MKTNNRIKVSGDHFAKVISEAVAKHINEISYNTVDRAYYKASDVDFDDVEKALKIFQQLGLIEILENGTIYLLDIQNFIGKSSSEADRQRKYYNKIKEENSACKISCKNSTPEIEIEKEIEIERDIEINNSGRTIEEIFGDENV